MLPIKKRNPNSQSIEEETQDGSIPLQSTPAPMIADTLSLQLGHHVIQRIGELSFSFAMSLSQTSKSFKNLFSVNHQISEMIHLKRDLLRKLLGHAALGELKDAKKIWKKHPDLLTCYGTIFHPNRIYNGDDVVGDIPFHHNPGRYKYENKTALQILWANEEYDEAKRLEDIVGPEEMQRQFFEVFPDGVIKKDNFDLEKANALLQAVFDAIIKDNNIHSENFDVMNANTKAALEALYAYAKPKSEHETGLVFDANFYLAALTLYDNKAHDQFKQHWAKYDFWCIRVEEWLAGCLGTGYLRLHAQGLGNNLSRHGCNLADGSSSFAFRCEGHSVPGLHFFVGYYGRRPRAPWAAGRFESYVKQKTMLRATYASVQLTP